MSVGFYRAFEDRHRGSRELIKTRLRVYLSFVEPLKSLSTQCLAVDLGCGRGEWLELLGEVGISAQGVDLDDGMLAPCRELGLSVKTVDAITYLQTLPDESRDVVSGFHLAEHLPFDKLQAVVKEALRVLKPAGLLILETPNPENIRVGTTNFYLDPTHLRPIPPQLLAFLPEHYGFFRTKILRLQESPELAANPAPNLMSVLDGASPDYAVVAQKAATPEVLGNFDAAFAREYGLCIEELAMKYEANIQQNFSGALQFAHGVAEQTEVRAQKAEVRAQEAQGCLQERERELAQTRQRLTEREGELAQTQQRLTEREGELAQTWQRLTEREGELAQTQQRLTEREGELAQTRQRLTEREGELAQTRQQFSVQEGELAALIHSRSWRITRPIRVFVHFLRGIRNQARNIPAYFLGLAKEMFKPILARAISFAKARPTLKSRLTAWVRRYPALDARLRRFAASRGMGHSESSNQAATGQYPAGYQELTPHARRIYAELKAAIEANRKEGGR